jgi:hypothetical protein
VPTRLNLGEIGDAYELAGVLGCDIRHWSAHALGRAAQD